jgi:hypothetical protein
MSPRGPTLLRQNREPHDSETAHRCHATFVRYSEEAPDLPSGDAVRNLTEALR